MWFLLVGFHGFHLAELVDFRVNYGLLVDCLVQSAEDEKHVIVAVSEYIWVPFLFVIRKNKRTVFGGCFGNVCALAGISCCRS